MAVKYGTIREALRGPGSPLRRTTTGYGRKIPTAYAVRLIDDSPTAKWRRVYAMCYSNSASLYVIVGGEEVFIDETALECALIGA